MKVFLKIISPKLSASGKKEFTIEDDKENMSIMEVIQKLESINQDLLIEISADGFIHQNYLCLINNELIMYDQRNVVTLRDGDSMTISFVIAGG